MTIARCLGFPHVLLRFVYELEHHGDMLNKVYARLDRLKNEKPTVKKWVIEFLTEIPLPEFQPVAREYIAKFESIRDEDFDFSNF